MKLRIENSSVKRFPTETEIREGLAETKRRQSQPGFAEAEKRRLADVELRSKAKGTKFPELLKQGTKPAFSHLSPEDQRLAFRYL
ncbi:MAG: hypothetical protein V4819_01500 [Verrucomicrobiota bacterium]